MSLSPLLDASWLTTSHAAVALTAFLLGSFQLLAPKGKVPHKLAGYVWCALMAWVAGSSLFIYKIRLWGAFSPVHLLSLLTLVFLAAGLLAARKNLVRSHRWIMLSTFTGALIIAGLFTLLPGRLMHQVLFGG